MHKLAPLAAAIAILSAVPLTATAQIHVSASVGQLSFTLKDLDPDDGVMPSIVFAALPAGAATLNAYVAEAGALSPSSKYVQGGLPSSMTALAGADSRLALAVSGAVPGAVTVNAALDLAGSGAAWSRVFGSASADNLSFTLTPHTELLLSASSTLSAGTPAAMAAQAGEGGSAVTSMSLDVATGGSWTSRYVYQSAYAGATRDAATGVPVFSGQPVVNDDALSIVFDNTSGWYGAGVLSLAATATASAYTAAVLPLSPVPEPCAVGMIAAGLLMMALLLGGGRDNNTLG